jgi:hypothetical protein
MSALSARLTKVIRDGQIKPKKRPAWPKIIALTGCAKIRLAGIRVIAKINRLDFVIFEHLVRIPPESDDDSPV